MNLLHIDLRYNYYYHFSQTVVYIGSNMEGFKILQFLVNYERWLWIFITSPWMHNIETHKNDPQKWFARMNARGKKSTIFRLKNDPHKWFAKMRLTKMIHKIHKYETHKNYKGTMTYYVILMHYGDGSGKYHLQTTSSVIGSLSEMTS